MRRRRPPSPLWSILVVVALLWSQVVYALHGGCAGVPAMAAMSASAVHADADQAHASMESPDKHLCAPDAPRRDDPTCTAHCAQETGSTDVGRIPPVPSLPPAAGLFVSAIARARMPGVGATAAYEPPRIRPRGPTGHPAPLLLI